MRRFYAPPENIAADTVSLELEETRHLRDVLRLRVGDEVNVFDGGGREFHCLIAAVDKRGSTLKIIAETSPVSPESPFPITLAAAILKGDKFDLVIQKAVELGIAAVVPILTARGDVRPKDMDKRLGRWRRIAMEATKQCGRARLMSIGEPVSFGSLIASAKDAVLFSERGGSDLSPLETLKKITAFVGPEGGWDDSELDLARSSGAAIVTLGGRILRAETASISICTILQHRFGDLK